MCDWGARRRFGSAMGRGTCDGARVVTRAPVGCVDGEAGGVGVCGPLAKLLDPSGGVRRTGALSPLARAAAASRTSDLADLAPLKLATAVSAPKVSGQIRSGHKPAHFLYPRDLPVNRGSCDWSCKSCMDRFLSTRSEGLRGPSWQPTRGGSVGREAGDGVARSHG